MNQVQPDQLVSLVLIYACFFPNIFVTSLRHYKESREERSKYEVDKYEVENSVKYLQNICNMYCTEK